MLNDDSQLKAHSAPRLSCLARRLRGGSAVLSVHDAAREQQIPRSAVIMTGALKRLAAERGMTVFKRGFQAWKTLVSRISSCARNRQILLQREIEQRFTGNLHLVSLGDDFRSSSRATADTSADCRSLAAASNRANDRSNRCSANRPLRSAGPTRLSGQLVFSCHDGHSLTIHHNPG